MDVLSQTKDHLHGSDEHGHEALGPPRLYGRPRVRDHEEDEQLIHRTRDRSHLGEKGMAVDEAANGSEDDERGHVRQSDVETANAPGNQGSEYPDNYHRRKVVAPL